jgi:hypothetical protein
MEGWPEQSFLRIIAKEPGWGPAHALAGALAVSRKDFRHDYTQRYIRGRARGTGGWVTSGPGSSEHNMLITTLFQPVGPPGNITYLPYTTGGTAHRHSHGVYKRVFYTRRPSITCRLGRQYAIATDYHIISIGAQSPDTRK